MLRAFHNDPAIKAYYLARIEAHHVADEIAHGYYWDKGKGCAVGCTLHSSNHTAYERELGIPQRLAKLEEDIFEALHAPDDTAWPGAFLEAIPVGAALTDIWPQFAIALLSDPQYGVLQYVQESRFRRQKQAIERVLRLYAHDTIPDAAYAAAYVAAYVAACAAPNTAYAATYAAANAAGGAAAAAAAYAAAAAAAQEYEVRLWQVQTLLTLLRHAPQPHVP